ncbi:MAG: hypothetical protein AAF447_17335 [Myxococcota bacterium]
MTTVVGLVLLACLAVFAWTFHGGGPGTRSVLPPRQVRDVDHGERVKLEGVVRLMPTRALLHTPITKRPCAAYGLMVERLKGIHWEPIYEEYGATSFILEQEGAGAIVRAEEAFPHLRPDAMGGVAGQDAEQAQLGRFCRDKGLSTIDHRGKQKLLRFREATLRDGDTVRVIGQAHWERPPDGSETYRDRPHQLGFGPAVAPGAVDLRYVPKVGFNAGPTFVAKAAHVETAVEMLFRELAAHRIAQPRLAHANAH